jgi:hypothetical protein
MGDKNLVSFARTLIGTLPQRSSTALEVLLFCGGKTRKTSGSLQQILKHCLKKIAQILGLTRKVKQQRESLYRAVFAPVP